LEAVSGSTISGSFGELRVERDMIEVTSNLPRTDKGWRYTDRQGHEHYWQDGYPTLRTVLDEPYWCDDCHDEHQDSHLECPLCSEVIQPGMLSPPPFREFVPGLTSYYLNDEPISEERAREIMGEMRR
jgi:hypothetical protein